MAMSPGKQARKHEIGLPKDSAVRLVHYHITTGTHGVQNLDDLAESRQFPEKPLVACPSANMECEWRLLDNNISF